MKNKIFYILTLHIVQLYNSELVPRLSSLHSQLEQLSYAVTPFPDITRYGLCLLDHSVVSAAPSRDALIDFFHQTGIQVIQLVVAWQSLTLEQYQQVIPYNGIVKCIKQITERPNKANDNFAKLLASKGIQDVSIGGGYASCGYHTLFHLEMAAQYFLKQQLSLMECINLAKINELFGVQAICDKAKLQPCGTWRQTLMKNNEENAKRNKTLPADKQLEVLCDAQGEWLTHAGMLIACTAFPGSSEVGIIYNERKTKETRATTRADLEGAIKDFSEKNYIPFWVNTGGHWYGIFIVKDKELCIIFDSLDSPRYDRESTQNILCELFRDREARITSAWHYLKTGPVIVHGFNAEEIDLERIMVLSNLIHQNEGTLKDTFARPEDKLNDNELAYIFDNLDYLKPLKEGTAGEKKITLEQFRATYKRVRDTKTVSTSDSQRFKIFHE